jgi:hypothetical protein
VFLTQLRQFGPQSLFFFVCHDMGVAVLKRVSALS